MSDKYEQLLERSVRCQEDANNVSKSLLQVADRLEQNTKHLNDQFVLHQGQATEMSQDVKDMKQNLFKWIKWLTIALIVAVGGATLVKYVTGLGIL